MVDVIATTLAAAWWLALGTLAVGWAVALLNVVGFRRLVPGGTRDVSSVSILVPARDEIRTLPHTLPALLAQGALEVVVLDDDSSDGTIDFLVGYAARDSRLRVVRGAPLPPGWSGKNWACHQLAQGARGDRLAFTDADVAWSSGALEALVEVQGRERADLVTAWPRQRCVGIGERLTVPLIDMLLLSALPAVLTRYRHPTSLTGANGQCMLWRRSAYEAIGGHTAVLGEVLEDVRLAQRAKRAGLRIALRLGGRALETRMYRSYTEAVRGFGKNALAAVGGRRVALVTLLLVNLVTYTLAWPLALLEVRWLAVGAAGMLLRATTNAMSLRSPFEAVLQPFGPLAFAPIVALSLRWGSAYEWRGRRYG
ncbi:glycosyltransferase family 2 protein [soil metagenome]